MSHRLQITLSDTQYTTLKDLGAKKDRSISGLIRALVDKEYGRRSSVADDLKKIDAARGLWTDRPVDMQKELGKLRTPMGPTPRR